MKGQAEDDGEGEPRPDPPETTMLRASLVEGDEPCTASGEYIGAVSSYSEDDAAALAPNHPPLEPRLRYQDRGLIGRGGQGEVRRVYDSHIGRVLAMKILSFAKLGQPRAHARFWNEARITANLQHPAIVPVHDMGKLEDGRPFFTMAEVQGRTFTAHIRDLHDLTEPLEQRRALRRIVQSLARACEGLAYAHSRGVMHRDIKPHNLMVGRFGEVQVMDWGLASRVTRSDDDAPTSSSWMPPDSTDPDLIESLALPDTADSNSIAGTVTYMAPEQARGDRDAMGPWTDVYSLGAVLYQILTGHPPYDGHKAEAWVSLLHGPPPSLVDYAPSPLRPHGLLRHCEQAMAREPADRLRDASQLAQALQDYLDDVERHDRAQGIVALADAQWQGLPSGPDGPGASGLQVLREQAEALRDEAHRLLADLGPLDPPRLKKPAWALQDRAAQLDRQVAIATVEWQQTLRSALNEVPDLASAHDRLARYYFHRLKEAEEARHADDAARAEALLRAHDRGPYAAYLRGHGHLSLATEPVAEALLLKYEDRGRRLMPVPMTALGPTPLVDVDIPSGSYLLVLRAPGHHLVRYPVYLPRAGRWDGSDETGQPFVLRLPRLGELEDDDVFVPAGPFIVGGDPEAAESLPRDVRWLPSFVMKRYPVTCREYLAFLNDLVARGRAEEAASFAPRQPLGTTATSRTEPAWERGQDGRYELAGEHPRAPVTLIDWNGARAYAAWRAERSGRAWRLPTELEWEKAARGVDGRLCPWGDAFDPCCACVLVSPAVAFAPQPVDLQQRFRRDCSPYGVRGMAGNVRDWCGHGWTADGRPRSDESAPVEITVRGGCWTSPTTPGHVASRFAASPDFVFRSLGFRLVRDA